MRSVVVLILQFVCWRRVKITSAHNEPAVAKPHSQTTPVDTPGLNRLLMLKTGWAFFFFLVKRQKSCAREANNVKGKTSYIYIETYI